ncbi:MAG TPA: cupredoxin domain-containing protein [Gemmatimonadaceae bacterium]
MNGLQWLSIAGGILAILWVNWYFLAPRRGVAAGVASDGAQTVRIRVQGGYSPQTIRVKRGGPVKLVFDRQETAPCSEEIVLADFGVRQFLTPFKETVVTITPDKTGKFDMTCGMSMLHGTIVVEA